MSDDDANSVPETNPGDKKPDDKKQDEKGGVVTFLANNITVITTLIASIYSADLSYHTNDKIDNLKEIDNSKSFYCPVFSKAISSLAQAAPQVHDAASFADWNAAAWSALFLLNDDKILLRQIGDLKTLDIKASDAQYPAADIAHISNSLLVELAAATWGCGGKGH